MPGAIIPLLKFLGTATLGLATGISYSNAVITAPVLLRLPNAASAQQASSSVTSLSAANTGALLGVSITSYLLAYALSPPRGGKHPYLLWTSLVAAASLATTYFHTRRSLPRDRSVISDSKATGHRIAGEDDDYVDATHSTANLTPTSAGSDSAFGLHDDAHLDVNGERVRASIETFRSVEAIRAVITGLSMCLGIVGIWGDGVRRR